MSDRIYRTMTTPASMMERIYDKPLQFSDCHGCNVIVKSNRTLSQAAYLKAHGQFITTTPVRRDQRFDLIFEGKGIVKFNAFPHKSQAVDWVRSRQPLPRGCRRLKLNGLVQYTVSLPKPGRCVLVESVRQSVREHFTFEAGPTTTLSFDIECGDILVHIDHLSSSLAFDTFCHSPHIKLDKTRSRSTASLLHYNPSSLCCLEDVQFTPGAIFRLEVHNSSSRTDSGSYIRVCVARQLSAYENNDQTLSCGSPTHPSVRGRRLLIGHNSHEVFIVQVLSDGLIMSRPNSQNIERLNFRLEKTFEKTLWFEIHKVSLRVWQVCERSIVDLDNSFITFQLDLDDPPPSAPAPPVPPPPRLPPRKPTVCPRRPDRSTNTAHRKPHREPMLVETHNRDYTGYWSDVSDSSAVNHTSLDRQYDSYVSMDNFRSIDSHKSDIHRKFTTAPRCLVSSSTTWHDMLSCSHSDTDSFTSTEPYLITFPSLESLNVDNYHCISINENMKNTRLKPHYEHPNSIWENSKSSAPASFSNSKNCHKNTTSSPARDIIKASRLCADGRGECKFYPKNSDRTNHNHRCDNHTDNTVDNGFVTVIPQCRDHHNTSKVNKQFCDLDRNQMCELWVAKVNDSRCVWSSQGNVDNGTKSQDCGSCDGCHGIHTRGPTNDDCLDICNSKINKRAADSEVMTSSVWLSSLGDDTESMQHNLDIHFVPVQGQLKCHSYCGDSINTLVGSRKSFTESTKTFTHHGPDIVEARNCFTNVRKPTQGQEKNQSLTSFVPFTNLSDININAFDETTLKKTFCGSTESLPDSDSTIVNQRTGSKSVNSGGFNVDEGDGDVFEDSTDPPDEITHLKHLAHLQDMVIARAEGQSQDYSTDTASKNTLQPEPCPAVFSQYCKPVGPVALTTPVVVLPRSSPESDKNQTQHGLLIYRDSNDNGVDGKSSEGVAESSPGDLTVNIRSDRENELSEQALDVNSGVIDMRSHGRTTSQRNIVESMTSNCATVYLSIGPTITLPGGIQSTRRVESTDDQGKNRVSASSLPFSNLSDNGRNCNSNETTLKKTYCSYTDSLSDTDSTIVQHKTRSKSVNSGGFAVEEGDGNILSGDCINPSDEITHLKRLAQLEDLTRPELSSREYSTENVGIKSLPPKPCSRQPFSQYSLAGRLSPVPVITPVTGLPRNPTESGRNQVQQGFSGNSQSNYNDAKGKTSSEVANSTEEALTVTNRRDRENELSEQEIDANSIRNHWRKGQRNIVESIISNSAAVDLTDTTVPDGIQPIQRSETLKRNLDSSPLNKSFK